MLLLMMVSSSLDVTGVGQGVVAAGVSGAGGIAGTVQMSDEEVGVDVVSGVTGMAGASQMSDVSLP